MRAHAKRQAYHNSQPDKHTPNYHELIFLTMPFCLLFISIGMLGLRYIYASIVTIWLEALEHVI